MIEAVICTPESSIENSPALLNSCRYLGVVHSLMLSENVEKALIAVYSASLFSAPLMRFHLREAVCW